MRWKVVIPVKGTASSKSRLNASKELAAAIAIDTVKAALGAASVLVVTSADAAPGFSALGVDVVQDGGEGLNSAIALGITSAGPGPVAVLLGDLPALVKEELASALDQAQRYPRAMVADADGRGTTLLTALRGWTHLPAFGPGSRAAHLAAGYEEIFRLPASGLRRDVDTADQLNFLARAGRLGPSTGSLVGGLEYAETASPPGSCRVGDGPQPLVRLPSANKGPNVE